MTQSIKGKVVLVTGVSSGLGKDLAAALLKKGALVAGTFRKQAEADAFEKANPQSALGIVMDITDNHQIEAGVAKVLDHFKRIDVLANNAGAGTVGAIEETSDAEARRIFDLNFFGGLSLIRSVLPTMRKQRSGHVMLFSAIGGFHGVPGFGMYASAKGATIILGESLAGELKPLGIDVTTLTIGIFDTGMSGRVVFTENEIADYKNTPAAQFRGFIQQVGGDEPNDPVKAADAIINLLESDNPPVNTALGADALAGMREKLSTLETELAAWEDNAVSTLKD